ncbi:hypothetical protein [Burkholderia pyrrocinia]|uniref:Uncharacterized protein n=1 Tax=Burkholderia pyrrocinia TaxID=60550 RepID=A0ABZ3BVH7_BURPY
MPSEVRVFRVVNVTKAFRASSLDEGRRTHKCGHENPDGVARQDRNWTIAFEPALKSTRSRPPFTVVIRKRAAKNRTARQSGIFGGHVWVSA